MKNAKFKFILDFNCDDQARFKTEGGGKAFNMALLSKNNLPVPEWFCVSSNAFEEFIEINNLKTQIQIDPNDLKKSSQSIETTITEAQLTPELQAEIRNALIQFQLQDCFVAVRSSGLDEDSADHSFAGQFSSYLFQKGETAIFDSLKKCWASGFSERALHYRLTNHLQITHIGIGVVIQKMVFAEKSGVVFSRNPIQITDREHLIISSVWGLGEGLVSGALDADHFEVNRSTLGVVSHLVPKEEMFIQDPKGGVYKTTTPQEKINVTSLTDSEIQQIAQLSLTLEQKWQVPQDSEWAIDTNSKKLYLVQTRPITNLPPNAFFDPMVNGTKPTLWDNSNIIESYSGVTSPLTFSFASRAYRQVYVQFCEVMGIPQSLITSSEPVFRNMLGLLQGRIYYNLINWYKLVLMLPGSATNKSFMETMMGVKQKLKPELNSLFDFVKTPPKYSSFDKIKLTASTLYRFFTMDHIISDFQTHFNKVYNSVWNKDFKSLSSTELVEQYHTLEREILFRWQAPIINDYLCMIFFGLLKKLTESWITINDQNSSLQNDLLCGEGNLESTEPTKMLMRIASIIDLGTKEIPLDPQFKSWFIAKPSQEIWAELSTTYKDSPVFHLFNEFLTKYGFRCINELKLEEPDLHDNPAFVVNSIQSYIRTQSYSIEAIELREKEIRKKAEAIVEQKLSGLKLKIYFWIVKQTRRAVKNRENLRFARTKIFGVARHLFRAIGTKFQMMGVLNESMDIFYLTLDEIIAYDEGRAISSDFKELVKSRKTEFNSYRASNGLPDRILTTGCVGATTQYTQILLENDLLAKDLPVSQDPNKLYGTPCCPGVIEGVVRVVVDPADAEALNGEILVTSRTDPGWVPLYPSCSGLLIERGSLLSHSAVVARELGLPTIVGISGGLMKKLKTGDRVRMDASLGEVQIL